MKLLATPALLLLSAAAVLVVMAAWRQGPKRRDVGTLLIWKRVAQQAAARTRRRRNFDVLLWLLLGAVIVGGIGAARPAWQSPSETPQIAVFIERLQPGTTEPQLAEAIQRAKAEAPDASYTFYLADAETLDAPADLKSLQPAGIQAELAQFAARSKDADGRILLLNAPAAGAAMLGRVLPRVTKPTDGAVFQIGAVGDEILIRATTNHALKIAGARVLATGTQAGVSTWRCLPTTDEISITVPPGPTYTLRRRPLVIGVGADWQGDMHRALYEALGANSADDDPLVWLGNRDRVPAVRINLGAETELAGRELSYDPGHPLFHDLPVESFDWLGEGRLLPPDAAARPLLSVTQNGERRGDLIRLKENAVLEFAGDPFSHGPVAAAALLLDNAIGVLTGERPSERANFVLADKSVLPTQRAAQAAPFDPAGRLDLSTHGESDDIEFTTWLTLAAGLLLLAVTALVVRRDG